MPRMIGVIFPETIMIAVSILSKKISFPSTNDIAAVFS